MVNAMYKFKKICKIDHVIIPCLAWEYKDKEEILMLENPKLVHFLSPQMEGRTNIHEPLISQDTFLTDIGTKDQNQFFGKFDKKNKNVTRSHDNLDTRKHKSQQRKKTRSQIHIYEEELLDAHHKDLIVENKERDFVATGLKIARNKKPKRSKKENTLHTANAETFISSTEDNTYNSKEIIIDSPLTVNELSSRLSIPEAEIIKWLFLQGISVTVNQFVDIDIANSVADHYEFTVSQSPSLGEGRESKVASVNSDSGEIRDPIITIFGHVDHGKTTLLDAIRATNTVHREAGGITQSIGAYEVDVEYELGIRRLVFLDTPGHHAFTGMRSRGAQVTDVAVLVVAADDGLKPQTIEAIKHIQQRNLPLIVAINKIDRQEANSSRLKEQLAQYNLIAEDWGGEIQMIEISALKNINIDKLLSNIILLADLQNLSADFSQSAEGTILEAHLDKQKGPVANVLVQNGIMNVGDYIVSDNVYGKIKVILDSFGSRVKSARPSSVAEVWGFAKVVNAGSYFQIVSNEKDAKKVASNYMAKYDHSHNQRKLNTRVTLDSYQQNKNPKQVNIILKTDTQGSIEAILNSLYQIPQEKVQLNILVASSGEVSNRDIELAHTSKSILLIFNLHLSSSIRSSAEGFNLVFKDFNVIYDLLDYMKNYMLDLVELEYAKSIIGQATVETVFPINKGSVAGCSVKSGKLKKKSYISVYRNDQLVYEGILDSLKRVKEDVEEVSFGNECGVMCKDYNLWQKSDILEAYDLVPEEKSLS